MYVVSFNLIIFIIILAVAFFVGWLTRSWMQRTRASELAALDARGNNAAATVTSAYNAARDRANAALNDTKK